MGALRAPAVDFVHVSVDFLCVFVDFWDLGGYPDICIYHIGEPHGTNDPFFGILFFILVRNALKKKLDTLVDEEKKRKSDNLD